MVNLAEANGQEKTEQPTGKRRRDARKKGNVFQSKDIVTVLMLYGVFWMAKQVLPFIYDTVRGYMEFFFSAVGRDAPLEGSPQIFAYSVVSLLKCALPLLLIAMILGILGHGIQTRFLFTMETVKPKFSKLNPISGIKKLFSLKKLVDLIKNLFKVAILLVLLFNLVKSDLSPIARMLDMPIFNSTTEMLHMVFVLVQNVCIAFAVVAFFDFLYQRWDYENNLKMTKQEVKDEYKMTEGNPEIKGRIRRIQRQMAMSRMMQSVPEADVVVKNPTHFAVALKYDPEKHGAPVVLAMGKDYLALRIIEVAEEHGVFVMENRPLARALYASCKVEREIPAEFYGAVAELLVYIYRLNHRDEMLQ